MGARHSPNFWKPKWDCAQPSSFGKSFPFPVLAYRDLSNALNRFQLDSFPSQHPDCAGHQLFPR